MKRQNVALMTKFWAVTTNPIQLASLARKKGNNSSDFELKGNTFSSVWICSKIS